MKVLRGVNWMNDGTYHRKRMFAYQGLLLSISRAKRFRCNRALNLSADWPFRRDIGDIDT